MTNKRINVWFGPDLLKQVEARGTISEAVRESLSRYYALITAGQRDLHGKFSASELGLICDVCNGTIFESHTLQGVLFNAQDTPPATYEKWGVDRKTLIGKLESLSLTENCALVDAIERFWRAVGTGISVDHGKILEVN